MSMDSDFFIEVSIVRNINKYKAAHVNTPLLTTTNKHPPYIWLMKI
jgi:hypothetical protein